MAHDTGPLWVNGAWVIDPRDLSSSSVPSPPPAYSAVTSLSSTVRAGSNTKIPARRSPAPTRGQAGRRRSLSTGALFFEAPRTSVPTTSPPIVPIGGAKTRSRSSSQSKVPRPALPVEPAQSDLGTSSRAGQSQCQPDSRTQAKRRLRQASSDARRPLTATKDLSPTTPRPEHCQVPSQYQVRALASTRDSIGPQADIAARTDTREAAKQP